MKRLVAVATSIRTSAALMLALVGMLLYSVVVPQKSAGDIATTAPFLALLVMFYVNLIAVLAARTPSTFRRTRVRVPEPQAAARWLESPKAIEGTASGELDAAAVVSALRGHGYRPRPVTPGVMYGVKHRHASIGFLLFHVSFLFLCAGGAWIWYTRSVGDARVIEGQTFDARNARVARAPKVGGPPDLTFTVDRVTPSFERGEAIDLRAMLRFGPRDAGEGWVNHPVKRGPVSLLVTDVGIAPAFWLQDSRGFGIDRVAAPADRSFDVDVPLAGGIFRVRILPRGREAALPGRDALASFAVPIVIFQGRDEIFRGTLRPGEAASWPGGRMVLTEVRYWAAMRIVSERGGSLLILGFLLGIAGVTWRLLLHRRDVLVGWDGRQFRIAGQGEWFSERDRRELREIATSLEGGRPGRDDRASRPIASKEANA